MLEHCAALSRSTGKVNNGAAISPATTHRESGGSYLERRETGRGRGNVGLEFGLD